MARIVEEIVIIKLSKLVKDEVSAEIVTNDLQLALEQVAQELVGANVIVEVERA